MLATKLHIPSTSPKLVHRSKLFEKLNEGFKRKLTLISAPAGFGKTTLLCDWINQNKIPAAWYSIDKRDNDPIEFLSYFIAGIQFINKEFGQNSLKLLKAPHRQNLESIIGLIINDILTIKKNIVIIFDDFHMIHSKEVYDILIFILEHIPENLHIIISTRSDPPLPSARLRSQDQFVEIRSSELSFTTNDSSNFFNKKHKLGLSQEDIISLQAKTEGWIAGLQLTALSMHGSENSSTFISNFSGDNRYIMDYLIEEVLIKQTEDVRDFLLKTSILEQLSGKLCDTILDRENSQLLIESLEKNNMFIIPLDTERNWYRYHHLFADLLKQRLQINHKGEIKNLHNKICLWFEENNMYDFAIDHAFEAENFEKAIQLLNDIIEKFWEDGHHGAILKYGDLLPDEIIEKNPNFCLYYSWILISTGKFKEATRLLNIAEQIQNKILDKKDQNVLNRKLAGRISVAFAYLASSSGDVKNIFKYSKKAYENVSEEDTLWYSWTCFSFGVAYLTVENYSESNKAFTRALEAAKKTANLYLISATVIRFAFSEMRRGNFKFAFNKCNELIKIINDGGYSHMAQNEWSFAGLYTTMAYIQNEWGEMDEAMYNIKIGYDLSKSGNDVTLHAFNIIVYARILRSLGDQKNVEKLINELDEINKKKELFPFLLNTFLAVKLGVYVRFNQLENAHRFIKTHKLKVENEITGTNELIYTTYVWMLLAEFKISKAEILLSKLHSLAESENRMERLIEIKILYSVLSTVKGNREDAINYLIEAIKLAENENMLMAFVNEGSQILDLLEEISKRETTANFGFSKRFLDKIIVKIKKREEYKQKTIEILSKRELDVLRLIAEELSNQEIADTLFVSLNTVKTHVKNIHLKLEVDSRSKAVSKAKELELI